MAKKYDWPVLQIALDDMLLSRSLEMAREAVDGGVDWIEAGTPLLKSEGMEAVRALRREFPDHVIVADMKTMDTGGYEVEMAAKAGADIVCVLGVADDDTISEAVRSALNYGCDVLVDMLGVADVLARSKKVEELGASYVGIHVGIDQQMQGRNPVDMVEGVSCELSIPVSAAGGINSSSAPLVVKAGASIVVVGGALTKAEDISQSARTLKNAMETGVPISGIGEKHGSDNLRNVLLQVSTCNLSDAMHRMGAMENIVPVYEGIEKMVGRAVTVETLDGDWAKPVEAIDNAGPENVIVVSALPGRKAVWGELATNSCLERGVQGVVVDGAVRDVESIAGLGLPVFSSRVCPNAGDPKGCGSIGGVVECGGQRVRPGDWVVGDSSGVVVIPQERAVEIANRALDILEKENRIRKEIGQGRTLSSVLELLKWEKIG